MFPVPAGDPDALDQAAGKLRGAAGDLDKLGAAYTAEAGALGRAWQGQAADSATAQVAALSRHATEFGQKTGGAATAVSSYAAALREAIATARSCQARAIAADNEAARQLPQNGTGPADARGAREQWVNDAVRGEKQAYQEAVAGLTAKAQACAKALEDAVPGFKPGMSPAAAAAAARAAVTKDLPLTHIEDLKAAGGGGAYGLDPPTDPKKRAAWWNALNPDEKNKLVGQDPKGYGSMEGLPAEGRDMANRIQLDRDIADLEDKVARGTATDAEKKALAGARAVKKQLDEVEHKQRDPVTGEPLKAQLYIYDPFAFEGQGRAAIVVGDLDTAQNVAVAVPGFTSDVPDYMDNLVGNATNLYGEARRGAPGESTAVVAWMGYDAPNGIDVATDSDAEAGAMLLAGDVRDIQTTRSGNPPHLTVVGHSYGSTTTSIAITDQGMKTDDVVLIGSPGAGHADDVGDLGMDKEHVYVGSANRDMVTHFTRTGMGDPLGQDPSAASFGATRFQAEATDRAAVPLFGDHSKYYNEGTESLGNIGAVVTGDYSDVETAAHRADAAGYEIYDPEGFRKPTSRAVAQ